jgi:hypothetical protein
MPGTCRFVSHYPWVTCSFFHTLPLPLPSRPLHPSPHPLHPSPHPLIPFASRRIPDTPHGPWRFPHPAQFASRISRPRVSSHSVRITNQPSPPHASAALYLGGRTQELASEGRCRRSGPDGPRSGQSRQIEQPAPISVRPPMSATGCEAEDMEHGTSTTLTHVALGTTRHQVQ